MKRRSTSSVQFSLPTSLHHIGASRSKQDSKTNLRRQKSQKRNVSIPRTKISSFWLVIILLFSGLGASVATLDDNKNIVYVVPRPGIDKNIDCYTNLYHQEIDRDLKIMSELGATTIVTTNAWQWNAQHSQFLKGLVRQNQSLAITLNPQLGDNSMRRYLEKIHSELKKHQVKLEFINVDYDLNFDNAEDFFMFAGKLRTWLDQLEFDCALVVQFFKDISSDIQIQSLLEAWDWSQFDAWGITVFSEQHIRNWLTWGSKFRKKLVFFYGADSISLSTRLRDDASETLQQLQISRLWEEFATLSTRLGSSNDTTSPVNASAPASEPQAFNATTPVAPPRGRYARRDSHPILLGVVLIGYVDEYFLGSEAQNYQGTPEDICPDNNPYLQTTCGVRDPAVAYGDPIVSVEHLGIFATTETLILTRCVIPKKAVSTLRKLWKNTTDEFSASEFCCFSISVYPLELIWITLSFIGVAILVSIGVSIASSCYACQRARWIEQFMQHEAADVNPANQEHLGKDV